MTSVALDSSGGVHVAYSAADRRIRYTHRESAGADWQIEPPDPDGPEGEYPTIAVD